MKASNFVVGWASLWMVAGAFALASPANGYSAPECRGDCGKGVPTPPQSSLISQDETDNENESGPAQIDLGEEAYAPPADRDGDSPRPPANEAYFIPEWMVAQATSQDPEVEPGDPKRTGNAGPR